MVRREQIGRLGVMGGLILGLSACAGSENKNSEPPKERIVIKEVGVPEAEVARRETAIFGRGIAHGQGVAICTMLMTNRNFEAVWEAVFRTIDRQPSLVPYLLGFLDYARGGDLPSGVGEERRTALALASRLDLRKEVGVEAMKDVSIKVLLKIIDFARTAEDRPDLVEHLVPSALREELRREMKRESTLGAKGERLEGIVKILAFIKSPEAVTQDLELFKRGMAAKQWDVARAAINNLKGATDRRVRAEYCEAYKLLYSKDLEPELAAIILLEISGRGIDDVLLGFASTAVQGNQGSSIKLAGIKAFSRFTKSEDELQDRAILNLCEFLKRNRDEALRSETITALRRFEGSKILGPIQKLRNVLAERAIPEDQTLIQTLDAIIKAGG